MPPRLIVIVSSPRSGSTWVGKLFDSHPLTIYRHEPDGEGRLAHVPLFPSAADFPALAPQVQRFAAALPGIRSPRVVAKFPLFSKAYDRAGARHLRAWMTGALKVATVAGAPLSVPQFVGSRTYASHPIVWKSIESTGRLGLLAYALPDARIVHLVRHPGGYVSSSLRGMEGGNLAAEHDVELWSMFASTEVARKYGIDLAALAAMPAAERLAWTWVIENEKAMNDTADAANVRRIRYEDICANPMTAIAELLAFADLPMHDQVREFVQESTAADNAAYYSVFKDPRRSAEKWRSELDPAVIDRVLRIAGATAPGRLFVAAGPKLATNG
jgi:hypothetical protein